MTFGGNMRKIVTLFTALTLLAAVATGCTSSVGSGTEGTATPGGTDVLVVEEIPLNADLIQAFNDYVDAEGGRPIALTDSSTAEGNPDWVKLGPGLEEGTVYGTNFACLVAQESWFLANRLPVPSNADQAAPYLQLNAEPSTVWESAWVASLGGPKESAKKLAQLGQKGTRLHGVEISQSGAEPSREERVVVQSALYPWLAANNLGTDTEWGVIEDSCVQVELKVQHQGDSGDRFVTFLTDPQTQQHLADWGLGYAAADPGRGDGPAAQLAPAPQGTKTVAGSVADWQESTRAAWANLSSLH